MDQNTVTELLKNYRSYRYAVKNCEAYPIDLTFGSRIKPFLNSERSVSLGEWDYNQYTRIVSLIDGAVADVLGDLERDVIEQKYLHRNTLTLEKIAERNGVCSYTIRKAHKRALSKLVIALGMLNQPEIHNLDFMLDQRSEKLAII